MKLKSNALYAGVLAGIIALPTTAIAAGETTTPSNNLNLNTATNQGVELVRSNLVGAHMDNKEATGITTGGGTSSDILIVEGGDIQAAVDACEVPEVQAQAKQNAMQMAAFSVDVDSIFNPAAEKAQGCLAATQEMINLAVEIPNISSIFDAGAALLQKKVNQIVQQKLMEVVDKGCKIANQAMKDTMSPLADFIEKYEMEMDEMYSVFGDYEGQARQNGTKISTSDYLRQMDLGFDSPDKPSQTAPRSGAQVSAPASRSMAMPNIYGSGSASGTNSSAPSQPQPEGSQLQKSTTNSSLSPNPF